MLQLLVIGYKVIIIIIIKLIIIITVRHKQEENGWLRWRSKKVEGSIVNVIVVVVRLLSLATPQLEN